MADRAPDADRRGRAVGCSAALGGLALGLAGVRGAGRAERAADAGRWPRRRCNPPVLLFTLALAIVTGLVFGVVPALAVMRGNTGAFLKDDSARGIGEHGHRR